MEISFNDLVGASGVTILLLAFLLNVFNKISKESLVYILMNFMGASLACLASYLINYIPFVILEACWAIVSLLALFKYSKNEGRN